MLRHFLCLLDLSGDEIRRIIARAVELKTQGGGDALLQRQTAALVFEKSSTRTRVSFETGIARLGGNSVFLAAGDSQIGRGEAIEDTARVLSRMVKLIIMRTGEHARVERMAEYAEVPVINALSDFNHPCQLLADIQTFVERKGEIGGRRIAWVGDGNNVCHSWMTAAQRLEFDLQVATPEGYAPDAALARECQSHVTLGNDPQAAVADAELVVTDAWVSMGWEEEKRKRMKNFTGFCVDAELMARARDDALFMHCLPAYRGLEVAAEVIDGSNSVVWDEAENRLHAQLALMEFLLTAQL